MKTALGTQLHSADRAHVLSAYVNRFTVNHVPAWARKPRPDGSAYEPQHADDADWLANTRFAVRNNGRLDRRAKYCESTPTWPTRRAA